jgi:hypothetical protein
VRVSENTVRAWIEILTSLYHGFIVRPLFRNVARALRKEPRRIFWSFEMETRGFSSK